jgi:ABC-type oligopeptide transport system ATPase subunit
VQQPQGLKVVNVDKDYPTRAGKTQALSQISLTVPPGEFVCAIGPSGCGKTSLLYILAGLEPPTSGQVLVDGAVAGTDQPGLVVSEAALFLADRRGQHPVRSEDERHTAPSVAPRRSACCRWFTSNPSPMPGCTNFPGG